MSNRSRYALVASTCLLALLVGLLVGTFVAKTVTDPAVTTTLTFVRRVPGPVSTVRVVHRRVVTITLPARTETVIETLTASPSKVRFRPHHGAGSASGD